MTIEKCAPVEMRKNLEVVEILKRNGLDFVAVPCSGKYTKEMLLKISDESLSELEKDTE